MCAIFDYGIRAQQNSHHLFASKLNATFKSTISRYRFLTDQHTQRNALLAITSAYNCTLHLMPISCAFKSTCSPFKTTLGFLSFFPLAFFLPYDSRAALWFALRYYRKSFANRKQYGQTNFHRSNDYIFAGWLL